MTTEAKCVLFRFTAQQEFARAKKVQRWDWSGAAHKHLCQALYWIERYRILVATSEAP